MKTRKPGFKGAFVRFLLRHWAGPLIMLLLMLVALTAYQMWRGGLFMALSLLPQLVTTLLLIGAVLAIRRVIELWKAGFFRQALQDSLSQGQVVLRTKVDAAKGALSSLGQEMKENLEDLVGAEAPQKGAPPPSAARCPSCNRFVKPGARFCEACGKPMLATCPQCGHPIRSQAKFCESCGTSLSAEKPASHAR
jgi:hypothetical protein